jgi:citrate lyase subunit beta/citryl-CoA lyase
MHDVSSAKSYLYVPGNQPDRLAKADRRGVDAVIADLEDAVIAAAKREALAHVGAFLARDGFGAQRWVRIEPDEVAPQLTVLVQPGLTGIMLPKADAASLRALDEELTAAEQNAGLREGSVSVLPLVESARALRGLDELAAAPRVVRLGMGEADLRAELGIDPSPDDREMLPLRMAVVVASAAAGIAPPVAPTSLDFRDLDALRDSTLALRRMGFRARTCIHPAQAPVVNEAFTPSAEDLDRARSVISAYDDAVAAGQGTAVDRDGRMVDIAVVRWARDVMRRA